MSDKVYQMLWDCPICGTEKLLGVTHRHCPNCGAAQKPEARYFPSDEDKIAVEDHKFVGKDRTCAACGELNSGASKFCENCGAPLDNAVMASTLEAQERAANETFESSGPRDIVKEKFEAEMVRVGVKRKTSDSSGPGTRNLLIIGAVILAIIGAAYFFFFATSETALTVTGHDWVREIDIEEYSTFQVSSWRDSAPAGFNVLLVPGSCREQQRGSEQVYDGEDCRVQRVDQGDGTFREQQVCQPRYRSVPVYDQMCTWRGENWIDINPMQATGASLAAAPFWPDTNNLNCAGLQRIGCQREAGRSERYIVELKDADGDTFTCTVSQQEWENMPVESRWVAEARARGSGPILCDTLKPAR